MANHDSADPPIFAHHDDQTDQLPKYRYQPLSRTRPSIRLLELLPPSSTTSLLHCTLKEVFLDDTPSYKALSYTWDTTFFDCTILINGAPLRIGRNLWFFLAYAGQFPQDIGPFWIDAICIDQANGPERNSQVSMMRQIYTDAVEGIVWLGADEETVDLCGRIIAYKYEEKLAVCGDSVPRDAVGLLNEFFSRITYWKRLWIVQEFILARQVSVCCGHLVVDLWFFLQLPESAYHDLMPEAMLVRFLISMRTMWHFPLGEPPKDVFALKDLLTATAESKSTVVIDRVYGLLGLALDVEASKYPIVIDYSKIPAEVFMDVIRNKFQDQPFDCEAVCNYVTVLLPNLELEIEDVFPTLEVMYPEFSYDMYHQYLFELTVEGNEASYAEYAEWARTLE